MKIYNLMRKWKLTSLIKDRLMYYVSQQSHYLQRQYEWKEKVYDGKRGTQEMFDKEKQEQIRWSNEQWRINHYKHEAVLEILKIAESL